MRTRGFEVVGAYEGKGVRLPARKTAMSAGYDIEAAEDVTLLPHRVTLVPTGLKAYMMPDEYLGLHVRSGFSVRHAVSCVNDEGIIDADYYGNEDNEGHIMIKLTNESGKDAFVKKGSGFAQGVFLPFGITEDDSADAVRTGGFGSTTKDHSAG